MGNVYVIIASQDLTGNYQTFPIISSIALMIMVYLFSFKITSNRFASIVAVGILEFSKIFMWYSENITYPNFWMVLFLVSLYPFKRSYLRPVAFVSSFACKSIALAFLPLTFLREKKKSIRIFYIGFIIVSGIIAYHFSWLRNGSGIQWENIAYPYIGIVNLAQDYWIMFSLPVVIGCLFYLRYKKVEWSGFLLLSMGYCMFLQYIISVLTTYNAWEYRMLPFVVFFAMSVALIVSKYEIIIKRTKV